MDNIPSYPGGNPNFQEAQPQVPATQQPQQPEQPQLPWNSHIKHFFDMAQLPQWQHGTPGIQFPQYFGGGGFGQAPQQPGGAAGDSGGQDANPYLVRHQIPFGQPGYPTLPANNSPISAQPQSFQLFGGSGFTQSPSAGGSSQYL